MENRLSPDEESDEREYSNIQLSLAAIQTYLDDDTVTDIFVDAKGRVSVKQFGKPIHDVDGLFIPTEIRRSIAMQIASTTDVVIDRNRYPVFEGNIPKYNARITVIFPPWVTAITLTIRKPPKKIFTLEEYLESGKLSLDYYNLIKKAIMTRQNMIVSGSTNSGKTTFLNAVLKEMARISPNERLYIVQDTSELQSQAKYPTFVTCRRDQSLDAVILALRFSPDRIIFGEIRDGFIMNSLLDAWNTGHPGGVATLHANTAQSTLLRIASLLKQVIPGEIPKINEMINLIIHMRHDFEHGVIIDEVLDTSDYNNAFIDSLAQQAINEEDAKHL